MFTSFHKVFIVAAFLLTACGTKKAEEAPAEEEAHDPNVVELTSEQYKMSGVQVGQILSINLSNYIKANGTIDAPPQMHVSITSPYGGIIKSTTALEGKFIGKGQVVATLENPEFIQIQQDYLESSSQLTYLSQDLKRQEELVREHIAAAKSLQRARSEYNTMVARVEGLRSQLRLIGISPASVRSGKFTSRVSITAPIGGYVTHVLSNVGKFVSANEVIADMVNTNDLHAEIKVFEKDIVRVQKGQRIRFRATGDSIERNAEVYLIGKDIGADRTVDVHGHLTMPPRNLLPGMFISAVIETGAAATPAVPAEAVVQAGGKSYIFILEEGTAEKHEEGKKEEAGHAGEGKEGEGEGKEEGPHYTFRRVEIVAGVTENGYTAITLPESFKAGAKIVFKGAYDLLSKMNNSEEEGGH
ncbi:efflux RND transporter periplasmic adaptor subunit [Flaviaesturariibacter amylovorans]|uniref:Efflux RND transporter periplasmic adaptor subunit n=1 Tax=Flaviaesturariibacter amylovorans TaxID=1084520 RepID=A0ABP8HLM0_9BACT